MRTEQKLKATAYHEAGHAVMLLMLGRSVTRATIRPEGDFLGQVRRRPPKVDREWHGVDWATRRWAETTIMFALAGPEAEERLTGRRDDAGAAQDDETVVEIAEGIEGGDETKDAYLTWLRLKVRDYVNSQLFWSQVEAVADALLERETLTGAEVRRVARQALGIKDLSITPPQATPYSRNIGYAWSRKEPPKSPDMVGTLAAVRGALESVHRELEPPFFERVFIGGVPVADGGGELSAVEILGMLEDHARFWAECRRMGTLESEPTLDSCQADANARKACG